MDRQVVSAHLVEHDAEVGQVKHGQQAKQEIHNHHPRIPLPILKMSETFTVQILTGVPSLPIKHSAEVNTEIKSKIRQQTEVANGGKYLQKMTKKTNGGQNSVRTFRFPASSLRLSTLASIILANFALEKKLALAWQIKLFQN